MTSGRRRMPVAMPIMVDHHPTSLREGELK
jgi:hypothetical protein